MSQIKKTITINKDYLTPKKTRSGGQKTLKNKPPILPRNLANKYLNKIKQHKNLEQKNSKMEEKQEILNNKSSLEDETDEFKKSLNFINNFTRSSGGDTKKTMKNKLTSDKNPPVHLDLPDDLEIPAPKPPEPPFKEQLMTLVQPSTLKYEKDIPYGCLKGGQKPTYRSWQKTLKRTPEINNEENCVPKTINKLEVIQDKRERLRRLKKKILNEKKDCNVPGKPKIHIPTRKTKRTTTKKYTLGKNKNGTSIGILIKDKKTRKKIIDAQKEMKKKDINEIKKYLYDHGLIKVGTNAPSNLIRNMYESSMLTGEIKNVQDGILINNYVAKEE